MGRVHVKGYVYQKDERAGLDNLMAGTRFNRSSDPGAMT